jgi:putative acetyltransferase
VTARDLVLRPYASADEAAAIELWRRTWQAAYPDIDFAARLAWWRERWRTALVPACTIMVVETSDGAAGVPPPGMVGFVTVNPATGYLDQLVVAPEAWGSEVARTLIDAAKQVAPAGLDLHVNQDNVRAIGFYKKHGFAISGTDINARSGKLLFTMSWRP